MPIKTYFAGQPIPENEKYAYIVAKDGYYVTLREREKLQENGNGNGVKPVL